MKVFIDDIAKEDDLLASSRGVPGRAQGAASFPLSLFERGQHAGKAGRGAQLSEREQLSDRGSDHRL